MTTGIRNETNEIQIRELIDRWVKALRAKDVDALMLNYEPDILLYDLAPPLLYRGAEVYRQSWQEWFASFQGLVDYEINSLSISAGDEIAFSTSINRTSGMTTTGEQSNIWIRATVCYRKREGRWFIAHEHFSVPFYMDGSFRAATDLEP
jgi:ketosteroid isomerase-like protein